MVIQIYSAATGEQIQSSEIENYQEGKLDLTVTKELMPFRLAHDETTHFVYVPGKISQEASQSATPNSQPATLESLIGQTNFNDVQNIIHRIEEIVNVSKNICAITESRWKECEEMRQRRSVIQLAKETLVDFAKNTVFAKYCNIIDEEALSLESNKKVIDEINFESILDDLTQNKTINNRDLLSVLQLDEKILGHLVSTVQSLEQMVNLNQKNCKNIISNQFRDLSIEDHESAEELSTDLKKIELLLFKQKEQLENLLSDYQNIAETNDELQFYSFEYQARNYYQEIVEIEHKIRESQGLYSLKDYECRLKTNQQMMQVCDRRILGLLVNTTRYFNQTKEGGALEKLLFLARLPDINSKLLEEISTRKENFTENSLVRNFRIFTEMVKTLCEEENDRRSKNEDLILKDLNQTQVLELKSVIPGVIGERIPVEAIIGGLEKLERSVAKTISANLPNEKIENNDEVDEFYVISTRSEPTKQELAVPMSQSVLFEFTDRKTEEQQLHKWGKISVPNSETNTAIPTNDLYQSVMPEDYSSLQNTINSLQQEIQEYKNELESQKITNSELTITLNNLHSNVIEKEKEIEKQTERLSLEETQHEADNQNNSLQIEKYQLELQNLLESKRLLQQDLEQLEKILEMEKENNSASLSQLEKMKTYTQEKLISLANDVSRLTTVLQTKDEEINSLKQARNDLSQEVNRLKESQSQLLEANNDKENQCMELLLVTRKFEESQRNLELTKASREDATNQLNNVMKEKFSIEMQLQEKEEQLTETTKRLEEQNRKFEESRKESALALEQVRQYQQVEITKLQETLKREQLRQDSSSESLLKHEAESEALKKVLSEQRQKIEDLELQLYAQNQSTPQNNSAETDNLKKQIKELTIKSQIYESATLKTATVVTNLQIKLQENQQKLKEQEESFKLIQEQYSQLERSYLETQSNNSKPTKTFVSLEPELNDTVIFFRGGPNKDLFTAISKNANRIFIAPESVRELKNKYGDSFDGLNIVVGKIVFLEQAGPGYNPFNLNVPYMTSFIEELL